MTASSALVIAALITLVGAAAIGIAAALASLVREPQPLPADLGGPPAGPRISGSTTALAGTVLAALLLLGALAARTAATGHAPWSNLHEFSAAFAFALLMVFIGLAVQRPISGLAN